MKTRFSMLTVAALSMLFLASGTPTASAQSFGLHVGGKDFGFGLHVGDRRHHRRGHAHAHVRVGRPVVHRRHRHCHGPACNPVVVPGHYETVTERVWRPGYSKRVWVPARYSYRYRCGRRVRVLVRRGYYRTQHVPGHWEHVNRRVWVAPVTNYGCGY